MIIIMLAAAMTISMLIATAFALHKEAMRARDPIVVNDTRHPYGLLRTR